MDGRARGTQPSPGGSRPHRRAPERHHRPISRILAPRPPEVRQPAGGRPGEAARERLPYAARQAVRRQKDTATSGA